MKHLQKVLSFLLVFTLLCAIPQLSYASDASSSGSNVKNLTTNDANYDIVFAIDESSSMDESDPNNIRHKAGSLFTSIVANISKARVGYVTFTEKVNESYPLKQMDTDDAKNDLCNLIGGIDRTQYDNTYDTDISVGLKQALQLIQADYSFDGTRNPCIILLSDGNTDFTSGSRTVDDAQKDLEDVLAEAQNLNVKIYTVGLNWDGKLDTKNLENISDSTGGTSFQIKTADEFESALIAILADLGGVLPQDVVLGYDSTTGRYKGKFEIENSNFLYANIVIPKDKGVSDPQLTYLDENTGTEISKPVDNTNIVSSEDDHYITVKIKNPDKGTWYLSVAAASSDDANNITVRLVTMNDIILDITEAKVSRLGSVSLKAEFTQEGNTLDDPDQLSDTPAKFTITDSSGNIIVNEESVEAAKDGSYTFKTKIKESGDYAANVTYEKADGSFYKESLAYSFTVNLIPMYVFIIAAVVLLLLVILIIVLIMNARKPRFSKDLTIGFVLPVELQKETPIPLTIAMPYKKTEVVLFDLIMGDPNAGRVLQNIIAKTQMNDLLSKTKLKAAGPGRLLLKIGPKVMGYVQVSNQNLDPAKQSTFTMNENIATDIVFSLDGQSATTIKLTYGSMSSPDDPVSSPYGGGDDPFGSGDPFGAGDPFGSGSASPFGGGSFGSGDGGAPFGGSDNGFGGNSGYGSDNGFGGNGGYGSDNGFGGNNGYGSDNGFGGNNGYGNDNGFGGNNGYGNDNGFGGNGGYGNYGGQDNGYGSGNGFGGNNSGSPYGSQDQTQRGQKGNSSQGFDFNGGSSGSGNDYNNIF